MTTSLPRARPRLRALSRQRNQAPSLLCRREGLSLARTPDTSRADANNPPLAKDLSLVGARPPATTPLALAREVRTVSGDAHNSMGVGRLVVILCGALFYVTVTFSFLLVYDTSKKKRAIFPPKIEGIE